MKNSNIKKLICRKNIIFAVSAMVLVSVGTAVVMAGPETIVDSFTDESKIGKGTEFVDVDTSAGQITLAQCYTADPVWQKHADTTVRDISNLANSDATVAKDIYCDDNNCILVTDGVTPSTTICVATDSDVYANVLWSKADSSSGVAWSTDTASGISGDDVGGTHSASLEAGDNNSSAGGSAFLERYYGSDAGAYPAMDACTAKGTRWRLPTIRELDSIRDQAKGSSPYTRLPGVASVSYWSSTESSDTAAYGLLFALGNVFTLDKSPTDRVRCVRGQ